MALLHTFGTLLGGVVTAALFVFYIARLFRRRDSRRPNGRGKPDFE